MSATEIFFIAGLIAGGIALVSILVNKSGRGNALLAASLSAGFGAFTAVQIWQEGAEMFWTNHTQNLTGTQVWWDLIICAMVALFFAAPRARKQGMNVPLWALFVGCTASIGLLAMVARLFWLENAEAAAGAKPTAKPATAS
ncbi:hypothetical protein [uncultured Erythrobacter sp.]|uniref:hypothetical protein n=1 Tax=uncultured Erythrobacter sp. TaxID=263913 RepID=UPI00262C5FE2|nr:hypothetical protein [uncultured Erythrobacter sp.]